mmetsp:Transcript_20612/g.44524  ORF Transcript_20612/g.44524 Transcript_20612/m.44524 type:complete len:96 (+) Transcript_20612:2850-3137(+)
MPMNVCWMPKLATTDTRTETTGEVEEEIRIIVSKIAVVSADPISRAVDLGLGEEEAGVADVEAAAGVGEDVVLHLRTRATDGNAAFDACSGLVEK